MKNIGIGITTLILLLIGILLFMQSSENRSYVKRGKAVIVLIEAYKKEKGYLPITLEDIGVLENMGEGPYYDKIDSLTYIVYFNIGFDTSLTYYSKTNSWKESP